MSAFKQISFSGGEIAPSLYARADLVKYSTGLRTCKNFIVARHGGVFNRPGSKFVNWTNGFDTPRRLIPWVFNSEQTYVLEFGPGYMRVIKNGVLQTDVTKDITAATNGSETTITSAGHGISLGEYFLIDGVEGMTELNGRQFYAASVTTDTITIRAPDGFDVDSTGYGTYTSGGTLSRVYELTTPYGASVLEELREFQVAQSADVMTIVHPSHAPRELVRVGDTSWTLNTITFAPEQAAPTNVTVSGTAGSSTFTYEVTAVNETTGEESLAAIKSQGSLQAPATAAHTISWTAAASASEYNVYLLTNGVPGYLGTAVGTSYTNSSNLGDLTDTPPVERNPFPASPSGNFPSAVGYFQQRRVFANTNNSIETVWTSRTGLPYNFTLSSPAQDDDAVTFTLSGKYVNGVKHVVEVNRLVALTSGGEWTVEGDTAGILRPTDINAKQHAYNGSSPLVPLVVNGTVLYVQARGTIVRDLGFDIAVDGYRGNDLTIFASHLFDYNTISDWAFQQIPHSIVWAVRDDGILLGLTYIREHEVLAWHRHTLEGGIVESVASVPEGTQDVLYLCVRRTINGNVYRYIERMESRRPDTVEEMVYVDSSLSYDGRHTGTTTMTLTSGRGWGYADTLTLTASAATFSASDVGNAVHLTGSDGTLIRFLIAGYTGPTEVTGRPHKDVPAAMQAVAIGTWALAVDEVGGLWHLEGEQVSVFADGFVVANPKNASYDVLTVSNGKITLDRPYSVIHVGLPIVSDIETLDLETAQGETMMDKNKLVSHVTMAVESSRGIWVGAKPPTDDAADPLEGLVEMKLRDVEDPEDPVDLETGNIDVNIQSEWNSNGRVFVRQVDPVPLSILSIVPAGLIPVRG